MASFGRIQTEALANKACFSKFSIRILVVNSFQSQYRLLLEDLEANGGKKNLLSFLAFLFHPGFQVSFFYRISHAFHLSGLQFAAKFFSFLLRLVTKCDVHYAAKIQGGVVFPHAVGVIVGEGSEIGRGCSLFHGVTLGAKEGREGYPKLEEGVNLYPGSVLVGDIRVGEYCRIGPNVYLTESLSPHTRLSPPKAEVRTETNS